MEDIKNVGVVCNIFADVHRQDNPVFRAYNAVLEGMYNLGLISRTTLFENYKKGKVVRKYKKKNIIAHVGFEVFWKILAEEYAGAGALNYMALGTGVGTPTTADTTLFTEVYRNVRAGSAVSSNVGIYTAFFTESEIDGNFKEAGNFIDGTAAADSGILFSKIQVDWVKSNLESLTVQCRYTLTNKV